MPPKQLRWYEKEFMNACGLAILYGCELSVDQFCASRGLEEPERDALAVYFASHSIAC